MPSFLLPRHNLHGHFFHSDFPSFSATSSLLSLDDSRGLITTRTALNPGQAPLLYQAVRGWVPQSILMTLKNPLPTYLSAKLCTNTIFMSNLQLFVWSAFSCFITSIIPILFLDFFSHIYLIPFVLYLACTLQIHLI